MKPILMLSLAVALVLPAPTAAQTEISVPVVEHYKLVFRLDPQRHALAAEADITLRNAAAVPVAAVPVLLYRLMEIEAASDAQGKPLAIQQEVVKFPDEPSWQVNYAQVTLPAPLPPGQRTAIHLKYAGQLFGYREVMQYVRDTISEEYSLIRLETMAYPFIAAPSEAGWRQSLRSSLFDYEIDTEVPAGLVAVCSGQDTAAATTKAGRSTYHCSGPRGSSHLSVAVAKFRTFNDPDRNLRVYALAEDAAAADRVMGEMKRALDFYRSYLGEARGGGLTLVEIPDGWGSYVVTGHIFQAAAAFKDPARAGELYHEVAHRWNVCRSDLGASCTLPVQRTRYFDEAFASYFEALALRQFQGVEAYRRDMQNARESFLRRATRDPRGRTTAIAEYAKEELGGFSYSKGAWSLYVLHQLLGEDAFRRSIAEFLAAYSDKPVEFQDFRRSLEKSSGRNLQCWYEKWILAGADSSAMLIEGKTVEEMAGQCQGGK